MQRELPAGLSDQQRSVLIEFFKGHISAGQLTERLGIEASPQTRDSRSERKSHLRSWLLARPFRYSRAFTTPRGTLAAVHHNSAAVTHRPRRPSRLTRSPSAEP
jgi:hypothetical protein